MIEFFDVHWASSPAPNGTMKWLEVRNDQLKHPAVGLMLDQFDPIGLVIGEKVTRFQVTPGNHEDFVWFVNNWMQPNVWLYQDEKSNRVILETWLVDRIKTRVEFKFVRLDNEKIRNITTLVERACKAVGG